MSKIVSTGTATLAIFVGLAGIADAACALDLTTPEDEGYAEGASATNVDVGSARVASSESSAALSTASATEVPAASSAPPSETRNATATEMLYFGVPSTSFTSPQEHVFYKFEARGGGAFSAQVATTDGLPLSATLYRRPAGSRAAWQRVDTTSARSSLTVQDTPLADQEYSLEAETSELAPLQVMVQCNASNSGSCGTTRQVGERCGGDDQTGCDQGLYCAKPLGACSSDGTCQAKPDVCLTTWEPVCGCNGQTYINPCAAATAGQNIATENECTTPGAQ